VKVGFFGRYVFRDIDVERTTGWRFLAGKIEMAAEPGKTDRVRERERERPGLGGRIRRE